MIYLEIKLVPYIVTKKKLVPYIIVRSTSQSREVQLHETLKWKILK